MSKKLIQQGIDQENVHLTLDDFENKIQELQLIAFGSEKGSIIFVSMNGQFDKIYTRFTFHRDEILELGVIKYKNNPTERFLLSFSREGFFKMVGFTSKSAELLKSISIGQNFDIMKCFENKVILTTLQGDMKIFSLKEDKKFVIKQYENTNEHERRIVTIDIELEKKFILTASKDNKIKIWNFKKVILLQINLYEKLSGAAFINSQLDLVFSHSGRISMLTYKKIAKDIESGIKNAIEYSENSKKGYALIEDYFQNNQSVQFFDDPQMTSKQFIANQKGFYKPRKITNQITFKNATSFMIDPMLSSSKQNRARLNSSKYGNNQNTSQIAQLNSSQQNKSFNIKEQSIQMNSNQFTNHQSANQICQSIIQSSQVINLNGQYQNQTQLTNLQKQEDHQTLFNQQYGPNSQVSLNQIFDCNTKRKQTHTIQPNLCQSKDNNLSLQHQKLFGSIIISERSPLSSSDTLQFRSNTTTKKQRFHTENSNTEPNEFIINTRQSSTTKHKNQNPKLNMLNSPTYFYSSTASSPKVSLNTSLKLPDLSTRQSRQKEIEPKKTENQSLSNEMQKIHKPLSLEQKFVCITALPKEDVKSYKYSLLEKFTVDRIARKIVASRRESTLNKIILRNLREPQQDFTLSVLAQYNPLFGNLTSNIYQRKGGHKSQNNSLSGQLY